jgi:hypothetical protein
MHADSLYLVCFHKDQYCGHTHLHSLAKLDNSVHPTQICADFESIVGVVIDEQPMSTRGPSLIVAIRQHKYKYITYRRINK